MRADRRIRVLELRSVRGTGGGPEKTILHGAALADRDRFDVIVCYLRDRRDRAFALRERADHLGIDYVELEERHSLDLGTFSRLRHLVAARRIDIVHAHEYKTDLLAYLLQRRLGVAALATAHGWTGQGSKERLIYYPVDKRLLARFDRVVAVSTDIRDELVRHRARPERVAVVLNAIDPEAFRRDDRRRRKVRAAFGFAPHQVVIGAVGRVERQKRFDLLVEAIEPLCRVRPDLRLVVAGDGSLLTSLRAQVERLGLGAHVLLLGYRADVAELHQALDLFVQSSEYEGTPNAVLEAMAMESPVIATAVGGTCELIQDGVHGLIVPARDVEALRSAIEQALGNPESLRTRAVAARRRVEADFSFAARTRRLETIYLELEHARSR